MAHLTPQIVVIGSLNMDLTARVPRLPAPGETILGTALYTAPGGKGGNQAVAAARVGATVQMVGCVGRDAYGADLKATLEREGVDVTRVSTVETSTGVALIVVDDRGQNQIAVIPGANADVDAAMTDGIEWMPNTWVVAQQEISDAAVQGAFGLARSRGARTILNAAPAREIPEALWTLVHVLVVNETEAAFLSGRQIDDVASAAAAANRLRGCGPEIVAITLGAGGSVITSPDGDWHIPALRVDAVDATAAGDAWVGAFAASLSRGDELLTAAIFASVAGAIAVTRPGAQPSLPSAADVAALLPTAPAPRRLT